MDAEKVVSTFLYVLVKAVVPRLAVSSEEPSKGRAPK
jgi:hypothetical protein